MLRPSFVAATLAASLTVPLSAQGWIDVERRPNVSLPASLGRCGSAPRYASS